MRTSPVGIAFIESFEGFRANRYLCPAGKPTIGYGHVIRLGETFTEPISEYDAAELLAEDLAEFEAAVLGMVRVPLAQGQFDALVSFAYNAGPGNLQRSTLLAKLNAGDYAGAADEFTRWDKIAGVPSAGLLRRREGERSMFLST